METGTILVNRWGYEQTNVDFYQVIKVTEKTVVIRQIAAEKVKEENLIGCVRPVKDNFIGEPMRRKIINAFGHTFVSLNSYSSASIWDNKDVVYTQYA